MPTTHPAGGAGAPPPRLKRAAATVARNLHRPLGRRQLHEVHAILDESILADVGPTVAALRTRGSTLASIIAAYRARIPKARPHLGIRGPHA